MTYSNIQNREDENIYFAFLIFEYKGMEMLG